MDVFEPIVDGLIEGSVVPVIGPGALAGSVDRDTGEPIPCDNRSLILAMNQGREMMPRLMVEFSRAAQHLEQRRGQAAVSRFLTGLYSRDWTPAPLLERLQTLNPHWVVDLNRDSHWQQGWSDRTHLLVQGASRIMGNGKRFQLYLYTDGGYREIDESEASCEIPVLFKPLGCPLPEPSYIASDADFVDYLTELMGGFAVPDCLKRYRMGRQYLLLGLPLTRDTERMLVNEISYGADSPRGWVLLPEPTPKEQRFCERFELQIIRQPTSAFSDYLAARATPSSRAG